MRASPDAGARAATGAWLAALWGRRAQVADLPQPGVLEGARRAVLTADGAGGRVLHLPPPPPGPWTAHAWRAAAAAHAAAHWRFGGPPQPRDGLKPAQLALLGLLEDARVEALALRELPGLRPLWLPFHAHQSPQGSHCAALLARLAWCLLDPGHVDAHPWVVRVAALAPPDRLAALAPARLRELASVLGNEIGQMRLPFDAAGYRAHAACRDDNQHLWIEDRALPPSDQPLAAGADDGAAAPAREASPLPATVRLHPEWDYRIGRHRLGWVSVSERDAREARGLPADHPPGSGVLQRRLAAAVARAVASRRHPAGRADWGDDFHAEALVEAGVRRRLGQAPDDRLYRRPGAATGGLAVLLLIDASASTGAPQAAVPAPLGGLLEVGQAAAGALEAGGHRCAALAFRSDGRHRVEVLHLKHWHERAAAAPVRLRYAAVAAGGSTRSGAAVRHATALLAGADAALGPRRRLVLLTDGEPHDVDVHDPRYLPRDLARALAEARRQGVEACAVPAQAVARRRARVADLARLLAG